MLRIQLGISGLEHDDATLTELRFAESFARPSQRLCVFSLRQESKGCRFVPISHRFDHLGSHPVDPYWN